MKKTRSLSTPGTYIFRGTIVVGVGANEIHYHAHPAKNMLDAIMLTYELYNELTIDYDSGENVYSHPQYYH